MYPELQIVLKSSAWGRVTDPLDFDPFGHQSPASRKVEPAVLGHVHVLRHPGSTLRMQGGRCKGVIGEYLCWMHQQRQQQKERSASAMLALTWHFSPSATPALT